MPKRTRQPNNRRPERQSPEEPTHYPEVDSSGIPVGWQQPTREQRLENERRARERRSSPRRPAEPSQWQQSPEYRRQSPRQPSEYRRQGSRQLSAGAAETGQVPAQPSGPRRRRKKKRPPLSTVLFPNYARRARSRRRRRATPDSRAERRKQRLKRQRRYRLFHKLFTVLLIFGMGLLALTLFFKVETISVDGHSRYTRAQLLEAAGIERGDNLYLFSKGAVRRRLFREFPYLDTVRVVRKLPNEVVIQVADAVPAAAVGSGSTYYYMDAGGKLLERVTLDQLGSVPVVTGVTVDDVEVGKQLNMRRNERLQQLTVLLTALEKSDLMQKVTFINLSDLKNVRVGYGDHMYIRFGTLDDLDYKMQFAQKFIEETSPSLYCELEVSGEILWEGRPSYRVIPVSEEEIAAQSRDLDSAAIPEEPVSGTPAESGVEPIAPPSLPGAPEESGEESASEEESGEAFTGQGNGSGNENRNEPPEDTGQEPDDDDHAPSGSGLTPYQPGMSGNGNNGASGNWRSALRFFHIGDS